MEYITLAKRAKADSFQMASLPGEVRNAALLAIQKNLRDNCESIFKANEKDLKKAEVEGLDGPLYSRLKFDTHKLEDVISGIDSLLSLPDPLFHTLLKRELDEGLVLEKITCPIGVIGVIFESRPDALVQISTLCVKSGNCAILKGGSEAANTNRVLFDIIKAAGLSAGLPEGFISLIEERAGIDAILGLHDSIDLLIPRGSNAFVQYIMANSKIPVMGHADGVCHTYVDKDADPEKAVPIIIDAKTQYVAACNATETLLVHKQIATPLLESLAKALVQRKAENPAAPSLTLKGDETVAKLIACEPAKDEDFGHEYLDYVLPIKIVADEKEAIAHINKLGSHHTDCILTENKETAEYFMAMVDSAGVYHNCSTRFADGFRYGFGAEVGISTGKLHARGPVGLEGLVTYKYKLFGTGQIVGDYASGKKNFNFKDLI